MLSFRYVARVGRRQTENPLRAGGGVRGVATSSSSSSNVAPPSGPPVRSIAVALVGAGVAAGAAYLGFGVRSESFVPNQVSSTAVEEEDHESHYFFVRPRDEDMKTYTWDDVKAHKSKQTGIWMSFNGGVYDVTSYVADHPGGKQIMAAAGGALEPYWKMYRQHKTDHVHELLDMYRIGHLRRSDQEHIRKKMAADPHWTRDGS